VAGLVGGQAAETPTEAAAGDQHVVGEGEVAADHVVDLPVEHGAPELPRVSRIVRVSLQLLPLELVECPQATQNMADEENPCGHKYRQHISSNVQVSAGH
jgi:hypothetical protein